ncbi:MAG: PilZ domain-containing protein [Gammaproteobacteria bacterium]|nr:PilZ domain-containing protein [Gammaproteobacteria bacterium]
MRAFVRHPADIPIEIEAGERITHAIQRLKNISIGGLCCQSPCFLENGLLVTVRIDLVTPAFMATGRVVWCHQMAKQKFEVGIQFLEAKDVFHAHRVEQLCYIEDYRRKVLQAEGRILDGRSAALEWMAKYAADLPPSSTNDSDT